MYKTTQKSHDFIGRVGSSSTRFHRAAYESAVNKYENFVIPSNDPLRMSLDALQDERADLLNSLKGCEESIRSCKLAGDTPPKVAIYTMGAIQRRIGLLNHQIKRENVRYTFARDTALFSAAVVDLFGEAALHRVYERIDVIRANLMSAGD